MYRRSDMLRTDSTLKSTVRVGIEGVVHVLLPESLPYLHKLPTFQANIVKDLSICSSYTTYTHTHTHTRASILLQMLVSST